MSSAPGVAAARRSRPTSPTSTTCTAWARCWPGPRWPCWSTTPGLVVYGATKAFVKELSLGLRLEVAARGVDVCAAFPGPVRTPMLEAALGRPIAPATRVGRHLERGWFMDPSVCVAKALAGFRQGRASVVVDPVDRAVGPPAPAGHPEAGRLGPAPPHRPLTRPGGVEAGQPAGVAWNLQMRP
jgi:NAD(P)-dependent dehydrogenase (short-subunit alcohol dehydrogenase family)